MICNWKKLPENLSKFIEKLTREDEDGGMGSNIFLVGGAVVFLAVFLRYFSFYFFAQFLGSAVVFLNDSSTTCTL